MTLSDVRALAVLVLLGLSVPSLGLAYARAHRVFAPDPAARRLVLASTAAAALLRWVIAPKQIVTVFIGYLLTQQAIDLSAASHYGMGSLALYHALFALFPRDHRTLLWANAVIGVVTLPLSAAFAARLLRAPRAGAIFAALVALTPLFVKNDASDANQVPCLLWLFGAFVLWEEHLDTGDRAPLFAAAPLLALAASARPEMPLLAPALLAIFTLALGPPRARFRDPAQLFAALFAAAFTAPQVLHVLGAAARLEERDSLPGAAGGLLGVLRPLFTQDTVLTPALFPVAIPLLALSALLLPARATPAPRAARLALALSAVIALAVYGVDLCRANMARVHVPGALLVTMLAAASLHALFSRGAPRGLRVAVPVAVALTALPTARTLWAPTNEETEEQFLRAALRRLPEGPHTLVRLDRADRDRRAPFTHDHFPDYLVRPPAGRGQVMSIRDFLDQPVLDRPAFFYLGMRCYAELRPPTAPRPHGDALQPACARLRERFHLDPVVIQSAENHGDVWIEYYGDAPELVLGLYEIRPR
jgi:hypothetical protein